MKIIFTFLIICTTIFQSQISASIHDDTREEWKKFQNGSLVIVEQIPGLSEELLLLPTTGHLRNPMFFSDIYSFVISSAYIRRLQPIIESYTAEHSPAFISQRFEQLIANSFYQDIPHGGSPHVVVFSKDEVKALQVFGIDVKEAINASNNTYDFYVKELRTRLISSYNSLFGLQQVFKSYELIIESPDLDALRESLNLPKQNYIITLIFQKLGALNG